MNWLHAFHLRIVLSAHCLIVIIFFIVADLLHLLVLSLPSPRWFHSQFGFLIRGNDGHYQLQSNF